MRNLGIVKDVAVVVDVDVARGAFSGLLIGYAVC